VYTTLQKRKFIHVFPGSATARKRRQETQLVVGMGARPNGQGYAVIFNVFNMADTGDKISFSIITPFKKYGIMCRVNRKNHSRPNCTSQFSQEVNMVLITH
jgi:hypothetical protein